MPPRGQHNERQPTGQPGADDVQPTDKDQDGLYETLFETVSESTDSDTQRIGSQPAKTWQFGQYEVLEEIARGGMGVVFKARHKKLNRTVALKMILSGPAADVGEIQRFQAEAQAAANLEHSGIIPIYEVGELDGRHFFTMAFVEGQTLDELARTRPLGGRYAAELMAEVAEAIQFAHEGGIVHRDLKPGNVLIDVEGKAKVMDFGLAKRTDTDSKLTGTGQVLGTPSFMAPEQAAGKTDLIGPLSDVYALGATLYYLLTGRPPFHCDNVMDTLMAVMNQEPVSPRVLNPNIPRDLETICLKCLAKERHSRYPSAGKVQLELERYLAGEPIDARPISSTGRLIRWCRRNTLVASLLFLIAASLIVGAGVSLVLAGNWRREARRAMNQSERARRATDVANIERDTAQAERDAAKQARLRESAALRLAEREISANYLDRGQRFCDDGELARGLHWMAKGLKVLPDQSPELDNLIRRAIISRQSQLNVLSQIIHHRDLYPVEFSADGKRYATKDNKDLSLLDLWDAELGVPLFSGIKHSSKIAAAKFSPDGSSLFVTGEQSKRVWCWDTQTGRAKGPEIVLDDSVYALAIHPDGNELLAGGESKLFRVDLESGRTKGSPIAYPGEVGCCVYSPDGSQIAVGGSDGAHLYQTDTAEEIGQSFQHPTDLYSIDFSHDGELLATGDKSHLRLWEIGTSIPRWQAEHDGPVLALKFSSDSRRIISGSFDQNARLWSVESGDMIGQPMEHGFSVAAVGFSVDDKHALSGAYFQTKVWSIEGEQPINTVFEGPDPVPTYAWGPERKRIAIAAGKDLIVMDVEDDGRVIATMTHPKQFVIFGFDRQGERILTSGADGMARVWNVTTEERIGDPIPHVYPRDALWTQDGKRFVTTPTPETLQVWNADSMQPVGEPIQHGAEIGRLRLSPDGKHLITVGGRPEVMFWDPITGQQVEDAPKLKHLIMATTISFSPDDKLALVGGFHTVFILDARTGRTIHELPHQGLHTVATFSPDGKVILTTGVDATVRLWNAKTYGLIGTPVTHDGAVKNAAFSPDSSLVMTRAMTNRPRLIDVQTAETFGWSPPLEGDLGAFEFSSDSSSILTSSAAGRVQRWRIPASQGRTAEVIERDIEIATGVEMDDDGMVEIQMVGSWMTRKRQANHPVATKTFLVTNTNDSGAGSLRMAMQLSNSSYGRDTIAFDIPGDGVHTIQPIDELPHLLDPVVIDATTQPGYVGKPLIELDGSRCADGRANGLVVMRVDECILRGLVINRFPRVGLAVVGSSNSVVEDNFIGTDPTGTKALGNCRVVRNAVAVNYYGGGVETRFERNLISGNGGIGLQVGRDVTEFIIRDNHVGTDITGKQKMFNTNGAIVVQSGSTDGVIENNTVAAERSWRALLFDRLQHYVSGNQVVK